MKNQRSSLKEIVVSNQYISSTSPPFIIAEMSGNHNQSLERALQIVEAVAKTGAHALKLQTYTADTMTLDVYDKEFLINDPKSLWNGKSLYKLYEEASTPWEWHQTIFQHCKDLGLICFSTPFDESAIDFLEKLNVPLYKIASFENTHLPLIRKAAATGKPLIISSGMASLTELEEAVKTAREAGCKNLILLKCTSAYPASPTNSHLRTIPDMQKIFQCPIGLSDHTEGIGTSIASVALGAVVIERHVTLSRSDGGIDSAFSLEPDELRSLVVESKRAWQSLGSIRYGPSEQEIESLKFRRSIYVSEDIEAGDLLSSKNTKIIRPGFGLSPKYYNSVLGKKAKVKLKKGSALSWECFE